MNQAAEPMAVSASPVPEVGPGALLCQTRIERQLSIENAAQTLRLAPKQLRALEQDDYDHLPGPTYVRGYLRSYAQLLGLSADTVLELYNRQPAAAKAVDLAKHTPTPQMSSDHHVIKITTLVVAGLVLGLAAIWWQGRDDSPIRLRKPAATAKAKSKPRLPTPRHCRVKTPSRRRRSYVPPCRSKTVRLLSASPCVHRPSRRRPWRPPDRDRWCCTSSRTPGRMCATARRINCSTPRSPPAA